MSVLAKGARLQTVDDEAIEVIGELGEGGQGIVYKVLLNGQPKALKWFWDDDAKKPEFKNNIRALIKRGPPSPVFLWPEKLTKRYKNGDYGYIMDLAPEGYFKFEDFMQSDLTGVKFTTYKAITQAAMNLVSAFRILHNSGLCYKDINDGAFFMNPKTGDVRIGDNDNVAPNLAATLPDVMTQRFMGPELVMRKARPQKTSDLWSMDVILFMLFCKAHPLEGQKAFQLDGSEAGEEQLYGSEALFIMDSQDKSNGPIRKLHHSLIETWTELPQYMKDMFRKAFSQEAIRNPRSRPIEMEWLDCLVRFRGELHRCPRCDAENVIRNPKVFSCSGCRLEQTIRNQIKLPFARYDLPVFKGSRIYRHQLSACAFEKALDIVGGIVIENGQYRIKNTSKSTWTRMKDGEKVRKILPNTTDSLEAGTVYQIDRSRIEIL